MLNIYWFRKDLRLEDNTALSAFAKEAQDSKAAFIYIKNSNSFNYFGEKRIRFLGECISDLSESLAKRGYKLQTFSGKSESVFSEILKRHPKVRLFFNRQVEPYCIRRDEKAAKLIINSGGEVRAFDDTCLIPPGEVRNLNGEQYKVFTPFRNQLQKQIQPEDYLPRQSGKLIVNEILIEGTDDTALKGFSISPLLKGGRAEGVKLLKRFYKEGLRKYKSMRDFPGKNGTSLLSPHLHFGTIGIREAYRAALKKLEECSLESETNEISTWINELIWREFYYHITFSNPQLTHKSFKEEYDNVQWNHSEELFEAWKEGKTGYPIVDAGMRQLKRDGWMHNRVRMITAMFLTKDLLIDWRLGEKHFAEHLIDLDFSSNNGGWQWSASTGVDAQPYFRIFNPYLQSKKFDTEGNYIREFVHELKDIPAEFIHEPHLMNESDQRKYNLIFGNDYPLPIVDHMKAKEEAITRFSLASGKLLKDK